MNFLDISCTDADVATLVNLIKNIIKYIQWGVVIILVLLVILDIAKAVIAGKEDEMKKAQELAIKRLIYGVVIFLVPVGIRLTFGLLSGNQKTNSQTVVSCILSNL